MKKEFWLNKNVRVYALLFGFCLIYFYQIIFGKYNFCEDLLYQYYPFRNFYATSLREGVFPLWDPFIFSGMSLIGDIQSAIFYPFNIVLALFVSGDRLSFYALELQIVLHVLLAGIFTYIYAREIKLSKNASVISAVTFMFSASLITRTIHMTFVNVIIWLPLILLFLHKALKEENFFFSVLGGVFMGLSMLAGCPQFSLHIFYFLIFYTLFFIIINRNKYSPLKSLCFLSGILIISLGISAIQYLPAFEYSQYTVRESMTFEKSAILSVHPSHFITFLAPKIFGTFSGAGETSVPFWGGHGLYGAFWETAIYIGVFPIILLLFAFKERKNKMVWFFACMTVFFVLALLGKYTPLYEFMYNCLPGFNKFRIPGRFSTVLSFSMAMLAGFGANFIFSKKEIKFPKVIFGFMGLVFIFWILVYMGAFENLNEITRKTYIYDNIKRQYSIFVLFFSISVVIIFLRTRKLLRINILAVSAAVFIFIDLFNFGHNFNKIRISPRELYPEGEAVKRMQRESKEEKFRINSRHDRVIVWARNSGNVYRLELIEGYTPLKNKRFDRFAEIPSDRFLDLLNAKYKTAINEETGLKNLVFNPGYLPRVFMVYEYTLANDETEALEILSSEEFDYRNETVLEKEPLIEIRSRDKNPRYKIKDQIFKTNKIALKIQTNVPGLLVFSEIYNPGWLAYIDGKETKIYRADYALRAIPVKQGIHRVELFYNPFSFRVGRIITLFTLIVSVFLVIFYKRNFKFSN